MERSGITDVPEQLKEDTTQHMSYIIANLLVGRKVEGCMKVRVCVCVLCVLLE